jgi:hypothetical protein
MATRERYRELLEKVRIAHLRMKKLSGLLVVGERATRKG